MRPGEAAGRRWRPKGGLGACSREAPRGAAAAARARPAGSRAGEGPRCCPPLSAVRSRWRGGGAAGRGRACPPCSKRANPPGGSAGSPPGRRASVAALRRAALRSLPRPAETLGGLAPPAKGGSPGRARGGTARRAGRAGGARRRPRPSRPGPCPSLSRRPSRPLRGGGRSGWGRPTPGLRVETGRAGAAPRLSAVCLPARCVTAEGGRAGSGGVGGPGRAVASVRRWAPPGRPQAVRRRRLGLRRPVSYTHLTLPTTILV